MNYQFRITNALRLVGLGLFLLCVGNAYGFATCAQPITFTGGAWNSSLYGGDSPLNPITCNVVVPAGQSAFLQNETLYFAPGVKWTVELGATFYMEGCTLSAQTPSSEWIGFEVLGDPSLAPTAPAQTRMFMRWNEIRHTEYGVCLGTAVLNSFSSSPQGGAVLTCEENTFFNNDRWAIRIREYNLFPSAVKIRHNNFITDNTGMPSQAHWASIGRMVAIENAFNVVVEHNQMGNVGPAWIGGDAYRGTGIHVSGGSVLARHNTIFRLSEGALVRRNFEGTDASSNLLFNGSQFRNNDFFNNEVGVQCEIGDVAIFDNQFVVDDNNILTLDRYDQGIRNRGFIGVLLDQSFSGGDIPMGGINIQNNTFDFSETLPYDNLAENLSLIAVYDYAATQAGDAFTLRNNVMEFDVPDYNISYNGMGYYICSFKSRDGEGDYAITCNQFLHDLGLSSSSEPIDIFFRDEPLSFGSIGAGAGNVFPPCASSFQQIRVSGSITADYYEVSGANGLDVNCSNGNVNYITVNALNTCPASNPPTLIPGSIAPAQYPGSNKTAASTPADPIRFTAYPNPVLDGHLFVELPAAEGSLRLLDLTGRPILQERVSAAQMELDLNAFAQGVYLLEYQFGGQRKLEKIILR